MEQIIVKEDSTVELEELHIILLRKTKETDKKLTEELKRQSELHELFKDFNPTFFEEAIPAKKALDNLNSSEILFISKFDFTRMF